MRRTDYKQVHLFEQTPQAKRNKQEYITNRKNVEISFSST